MNLKYEYEEKKVLPKEIPILIKKILIVLVGVCIIIGIVYLIFTNDDSSYFNDAYLIGVILGVSSICILLEFLLKDSTYKAKHQKIKRNGKSATGYIYDIHYINDRKLINYMIEVIVNGKTFEIGGLLNNEAFNHIYENKHKLRFIPIPVTVYLYNDNIYIDLSSADVYILDSLHHTYW